MAALGQQQNSLLSGTHRHLTGAHPRIERRKRLRIVGGYPARVKCTDPCGERIRDEAILDNLSSNGLYMHVRHEMVAGQKACIVFQMINKEMIARSTRRTGRTPRVAVRGSVLRVDSLEDGLWGVAVTFRQYRFL